MDKETTLGEGPQQIAKYTCKGCKHFSSEYWREPSGDGETYDSGTSATCNLLKKNISSYYGSAPVPPEWCPFKNQENRTADYEKILKDMARQRTTDEMSDEELDNADIDGAYDTFIKMSRDVLKLVNENV